MKNNKLNYALLLLIIVGCNSGELVPSVYVDTKNSTVVCNNCKIKEMFVVTNYDKNTDIHYSYKNYLIDNSTIDIDTVKFIDLKNRNDTQSYLKKTDLSDSNFKFCVELKLVLVRFFLPLF
jgi:uncharacterized protein YcfL